MGIWFFYPLPDTWARKQGFVRAIMRQMAAKYGLRYLHTLLLSFNIYMTFTRSLKNIFITM